MTCITRTGSLSERRVYLLQIQNQSLMGVFMKLQVIVFMLLISTTALAAREAPPKMVCKKEGVIFSISRDPQGYALALINEVPREVLHTMKQLMPQMSEEQIKAQYQKSLGQESQLEQCAKLQKCDFFSPGQATLARCTTKSESSELSLSVILQNGVYNLKCDANSSVKTKSSSVDSKGSFTLGTAFASRDCTINPALP